MTNNEALWTPSENRIKNSQMFQFMMTMNENHQSGTNYQDFHSWSVEQPETFWASFLEYAEIITSKLSQQVLTGDTMIDAKWFPGTELNFAENLLTFRDDRPAIIATDERKKIRTITYKELHHLVASCQKSLIKSGVKKGDRVVGMMPNIPESIIAMLAATSMGAIWSSCSPDFGIGGVVDRFGQIEPKILITTDGYSYAGKPIDICDRINGITDKISSIEKTIVVPFLDGSDRTSSLKNAILWDDFLIESDTILFEQTPFDFPVYIMYSSGTTGIPKCIVHGAGGTLIQHKKELMLHCDLKRDDKIMYFTTCGWMMWNWLVSSLSVGATVLLYEGNPGYPNMNSLWDFADETGMTIFGTSPKFLSACEKSGISPKTTHKLNDLRAMLSTGSPLTNENFQYVYDRVKEDLQLSSISGGTDIISCFMLGNPILPVYAGEIQCAGLGMDIRAFDENGKPVKLQKGELVCCTPFPSQPIGFWNDPEKKKYHDAYFDHYDGIWRHGDFIKITEHGGIIVYGRSDATLNPGGIRIGTAEIYRQVESLEFVQDSVVIGKDTEDGDIDICLFVVLKDGLTLTDELEKQIQNQIIAGATRRHCPKYIRQVSAVPYTISGKKVELAVKQMVQGEAVLNKDALSNPESLDQYAGII